MENQIQLGIENKSESDEKVDRKIYEFFTKQKGVFVIGIDDIPDKKEK